MLITTMNDVPGYAVQEVFGEVFGLTVRSRNVGSQIGASFKSMLGGVLEVTVFEQLDAPPIERVGGLGYRLGGHAQIVGGA